MHMCVCYMAVLVVLVDLQDPTPLLLFWWRHRARPVSTETTSTTNNLEQEPAHTHIPQLGPGTAASQQDPTLQAEEMVGAWERTLNGMLG